MSKPLSPQTSSLTAGRLIGGHYQVERRLAVGGFGQTFVARDLHLPGQPACVIKQLRLNFSDPSLLKTAQRLFDSEAKTLYALGEHAQIPRLLAHFEENQQFYLVQELIEGGPLSDLLVPGQPWVEIDAIALIQDILQVLAFIHDQGVIHRDIKPDNLLWRTTDERIVLIDFGAVKLVEQMTQLSQMPSTGAPSSLTIAVGTPGYMPIEQRSGKPRFSSDIYSVGMVAIQAVTGLSSWQLEHDDTTGEIEWRSHAPHISDRLVDILDKMVRYDFRQRYTNAAEALEAVHNLPQRTLSCVKRSGYLPAVSLPSVVKSKPTPSTSAPVGSSAGPPASMRDRLLKWRSTGSTLVQLLSGTTPKIVAVTLLALGSSFFALQWRTRLNSVPTSRPSPTSTPSPTPTLSPASTPSPTPTPSPTSAPEESEAFSAEQVAELESQIANATRQDAIDITANMLASADFGDVLMTLAVFDGRWPNDPTLSLHEGKALNGLVRHEEALAVVEDAISVHPDNRALSRERVLALTGLSRQSNSDSIQKQYLDEAADELRKEFDSIAAEQSNYPETKKQDLLAALDKFKNKIETTTAEQSSDSTKNQYLAEAIEEFVAEIQTIVAEE